MKLRFNFSTRITNIVPTKPYTHIRVPWKGVYLRRKWLLQRKYLSKGGVPSKGMYLHKECTTKERASKRSVLLEKFFGTPV